MGTGSGGKRLTKVERVVDEYDLDGIESTLATRWTGDGDDRWSLRDLADFFNERVLEAALLSAGEQPLDGEVANYYRLLTTDDVSAGARTEARKQLERAGVDVDDLRSDFVSHQAVHTFLTSRQEVTYEGASGEQRLESSRDTINRLESRTESVTRNTVGALRDADVLDIEEFSVIADVAVVCDDCGRRHDVSSLLVRGGCQCQ
jgi:hypothetical protein